MLRRWAIVSTVQPWNCFLKNFEKSKHLRKIFFTSKIRKIKFFLQTCDNIVCRLGTILFADLWQYCLQTWDNIVCRLVTILFADLWQYCLFVTNLIVCWTMSSVWTSTAAVASSVILKNKHTHGFSKERKIAPLKEILLKLRNPSFWYSFS